MIHLFLSILAAIQVGRVEIKQESRLVEFAEVVFNLQSWCHLTQISCDYDGLYSCRAQFITTGTFGQFFAEVGNSARMLEYDGAVAKWQQWTRNESLNPRQIIETQRLLGSLSPGLSIDNFDIFCSLSSTNKPLRCTIYSRASNADSRVDSGSGS